MAIGEDYNNNEYDKFYQVDGRPAIRVKMVGASFDNLEVTNNNVDTSGYIGKPSADNADFSTAYLAATQITIASLPSDVTAFEHQDIVSVVQINTTGSVEETYMRNETAMTLVGGVLTVAGASFAATDTFIVYTNVPRPVGGGSGSSAGGSGIIIGNEVGEYDFDASAQTITCTGIKTLKLEDLQMITNVFNGTNTVIYSPSDSAKGASISANVITLAYDTTGMNDSDPLQIYVQYNNSEDYSQGISKVIEQTKSKKTSPVPIVTAQDLTASYADFGGHIDMTEHRWLGIDVGRDINTSENVLMKLLAAMSYGGTEAEIDGLSVVTLWTTVAGGAVDGNTYYLVDTGTIPYIQIQSKAGTLGTAGDLTIKINKW